MVKYITLAGRKQVGKDTSARYIKTIIEQHTTLKVHIVHFADALKDACELIFGIPRQKMETELGKQELTDVLWPTYDESSEGNTLWRPCRKKLDDMRYMTVREVLQFVGTELFRSQMDPDIWVQSVFRRKYPDDDIVVVADCRFPNEGDFAKEHGLLIKVERETGIPCDGHASEVALDNYDAYDDVVQNNGTFGTLRDSLTNVLRVHGFLV